MRDLQTAIRTSVGLVLTSLCIACGTGPANPSAPPTELPATSSPAASSSVAPSLKIDPERPVEVVTCGGPSFPVDLIDEPGNAETFGDPAAEALRQLIGSTEAFWLPKTGWREVVRTDDTVLYLGEEVNVAQPSWAQVMVEFSGEEWEVTGWGTCTLQADVGPGMGFASYRVDPAVELDPGMTEIQVLVTERACNGGRDARGRIAEPRILLGDDAITVVFAVRPNEGMATCPSNPETPYVLVLPEPIGNRTLLDGSEVPPRDAMLCADIAFCVP